MFISGSYLYHDRLDLPMSDKSILKEVVSFVIRLHVFTVIKKYLLCKLAIVKQINSQKCKTVLFRFTKQFNSVSRRSEEICETLL